MTEEDKKEFEEFLEWKKQKKEDEQFKAEQQKAERQEAEQQKAEQSAPSTSSTLLPNKETENKKVDAENTSSKPQEYNTPIKGIMLTIVILVVVIILIITIVKGSDQGSAPNSSYVDTSYVDTTNVEEKQPKTSKIGPKYDWWVQAQYANADYDYKSITNGQRFAIEDGVTLIDDMISNVNKLESIINDDEYQIDKFPDFYKTPTMAAKLKRNHKAAEKELERRLPQYRKYYVKTASQILWKHDIKVKSSGTTIWFIGAVFASNANIEEFHNDQEEKLRTLGFKKACYKWVDADVEYTYYNL